MRAGLREISAGDLEMANDDKSIQKYLSVVMAWADGEEGIEMPGANRPGIEVLAEFDSIVEEVLDAGVQSAVLVSHGAMIRTWVGSRAVNLDAGFVAQNAVSNTGIVILEYIDERWHVIQW